MHDRVHLEFIYNAQFTRPSCNGGLEHTLNVFCFYFKIGLQKGLLERLSHPDADE
jgi:hypothetical protein